MKLRPCALAGFLFPWCFPACHCRWNGNRKVEPAGIGETGTEELGEEHETTTLPELHGYMNLLEYLKEMAFLRVCGAAWYC